jgi:hypothetical protein
MEDRKADGGETHFYTVEAHKWSRECAIPKAESWGLFQPFWTPCFLLKPEIIGR